MRIEIGTDMFACGEIGKFMVTLLESKGFRVIPWVAGGIEEGKAEAFSD